MFVALAFGWAEEAREITGASEWPEHKQDMWSGCLGAPLPFSLFAEPRRRCLGLTKDPRMWGVLEILELWAA